MLSLSDPEKNPVSGMHAVPLSAVEAGRRVYITAVDAGQGLQGRLAAMGLVPGVQVDVIMNSRRGPFIVVIKGSRVILGQGMAKKIIVV